MILENLFHPDDFIEDASLLKDLEFDIRSECQKMGAVEKVGMSLSSQYQSIVPALLVYTPATQLELLIEESCFCTAVHVGPLPSNLTTFLASNNSD